MERQERAEESVIRLGARSRGPVLHNLSYLELFEVATGRIVPSVYITRAGPLPCNYILSELARKYASPPAFT